MILMIACVGKNGELGLDGRLVFHIKEDMQFFKETTMGHPVFMGSKTFFSLPKALPGRDNYVLTSHPEKLPEGVFPVSNIKDFVGKFQDSSDEAFVIGGAQVYAEMLPYTNVIYLTEVDAVADADAFFPAFDKDKYDRIELKKGSCDDLNYTFAKYIKK